MPNVSRGILIHESPRGKWSGFRILSIYFAFVFSIFILRPEQLRKGFKVFKACSREIISLRISVYIYYLYSDTTKQFQSKTFTIKKIYNNIKIGFKIL